MSIEEMESITKDLVCTLKDKPDAAISEKLDSWMKQTTWGSEFEAQMLLVFIDCLIEAIGSPKLSPRDMRELFISVGIASKIDSHFWGLKEHRKAPGFFSLELLKIGLFGKREVQSKEERKRRVRSVASLDAEHIIQTGNPLSGRKLAKIIGVDANTIKADRDSVEYEDLMRVMPKILR